MRRHVICPLMSDGNGVRYCSPSCAWADITSESLSEDGEKQVIHYTCLMTEITERLEAISENIFVTGGSDE